MAQIDGVVENTRRAVRGGTLFKTCRNCGEDTTKRLELRYTRTGRPVQVCAYCGCVEIPRLPRKV